MATVEKYLADLKASNSVHGLFAEVVEENDRLRKLLDETIAKTSCYICLEVLQPMHTPQCGHSICLQCAQKVCLLRSEGPHRASCPLCRKCIHYESDGQKLNLTSTSAINDIHEHLRPWFEGESSQTTGGGTSVTKACSDDLIWRDIARRLAISLLVLLCCVAALIIGPLFESSETSS